MIQLDRDFWVAAAGLANTRTSQFDKRGRAAVADRGPLNLLVDIQGAACELIALKYINDFVGAASFQHTILDKHGKNGEDMRFTTHHGKEFKLDVKGLFATDMERKWRGNFLVAPKAVEQASLDDLKFALVLTTFGCDRAYVSNLVRWETVMSWPQRDFGYGGDPHHKPLPQCIQDHFRIAPERVYELRERQFKLARLDEDLAALTLPEKLPEGLVDQRTLRASDIIYRMAEHVDMIQKAG